jgi:hypothetical protein
MYATGLMGNGVQDRSRGAPNSPQDAPNSPQGAPNRPPSAGRSDRYEALPGIAGLPKWIWQKLPPAGRIGLALLPFAIIALVLLLGPGIDESKDRRAEAERDRLAQLAAERVERIRVEQRPRFRRGAPAGQDLAARAALVGALPAAIQGDARQRVAAGTLDGPIRSVECEPYPRSVDARGAHLDPSETTGRYSCLAITREVQATERNEAAAIGHPYRVLVHFDTGRYAFCKVSGRPGEGSLGREIPAPVPEACGGR